MEENNKLTTWHQISGYRWLVLISILFLNACRGGDIPALSVQPETSTSKAIAQPTSTDLPTETSSPTVTWVHIETPTPSATPVLIQTPVPTVSGVQIIRNGGFDQNVSGWEQPYGKLRHTTLAYTSGPGAARLTTQDSSGSLDYLGSFGQCIDLTSLLDGWTENQDARQIVLEAYVQPGPGITSVTLNAIFSDDNHCGTGHVGSLSIPAVLTTEGWIHLITNGSLPESARSIHIFVRASGNNAEATLLIDDIRAYSPELDDNL